jgi:hypothetical protein
MRITAQSRCPTLTAGEFLEIGESADVDDCFYWREQIRNGVVALAADEPPVKTKTRRTAASEE